MDEKSPKLSRRHFIGGTGTLLAGLELKGRAATSSSEGSPSEPPMPMETLGRTGVQVSRLGIGCGPFGDRHVDAHDAAAVLHHSVEIGINYLDVAPNYGSEETGFSEAKMGPTIKEIRDRIFLVTKTEEASYEGTWRLLRQSLKRLQTDHLDLVHLHNFGLEDRFPDVQAVLGKKGALGALLDARRQGVLRFIGASGHLYPSRFHALLDTGEIDVLMNAVNFVVQHTYDFEHKVWSRAREKNLGLVAMKVLGGRSKDWGLGSKNRYRVPKKHFQSAIQYALSIPGVSCAVIGIENVRELKETARVVREARPMTAEELHQLKQVGLNLAQVKAWRAAYGEPIA